MRRKIIILCVAIMIFIFGVYLGHQQKMPEPSNIESPVAVGAAVYLRNNIKLLNYLQNGKINESKELLEHIVDVEISFLGDNLKHAKYPLPMEKRMREAMREAKKYRKRYPNHKPEPMSLNKAVEEAFRNISGQ